ncbi:MULTISPECIES: hypothetical protein [unclassified Pantoea]|uniref:hypothetical protein n=1 Tax=unclassified Pantoea TaxID=2630326 RepID=UPI00211805C3|nr:MULTISPECIES: hypothetical protein [unclassified Pantoea]
MTFTAKFIPDESVIDGLGTPDDRGYYNVDFEFLDVIQITETDPQQLVCSYSLTLNETILNYRFRFGYAFDGSNATAEAAEAALKNYLNEMYVAAGG